MPLDQQVNALNLVNPSQNIFSFSMTDNDKKIMTDLLFQALKGCSRISDFEFIPAQIVVVGWIKD